MAIRWSEQWAEVFTLAFIALGFILALLLRSPALSYLSVFIAGFLAARTYYLKRFKEPILPFILIIVGFLVGYLIGSVWVLRFWVLFFFGVGFALSYYLHLKQILVSFKSENYIK